MKLILLSITFVLLFATTGTAQSCTPGANYADSSYGVWPNIATNLPIATQNVPYSAVINFKVPATVTAELDETGQFVGTPIQDFEVTGVNGLPSGFSYACNIATCQYLGGENGCASIYGTCATTGIYPVTIDVDATVLVSLLPGLPPIPVVQTVSFDGYFIEVGTAGTIVQFIEPITAFPNPANEEIKIQGITPSMQANEISIVNIEGKVVANRKMTNTTNLTFDISLLKAGIYFVNVSLANGIETIKFVKQ